MAASTNSRVVIDTSALLSFVFPDESTPPEISKILRLAAKNKKILLAPTLLKYELGNSIRSAIKQKRINILTAIDILDHINKLKIYFLDPDSQKTLELSIKNGLTFYDASYLALSIEKNAKLLTLDKKLHDCLKTE